MTQTSNRPHFLHPYWGFFAIFVLGFPLFFLVLERTGPPPIIVEDYGAAPRFSLKNQHDKAVDNTHFQQQPSIINFIYTRCPDVCPRLSASMSNLQTTRGFQNTQFVSITVDPKHDTSEVLKKYGERFNANQKRWFFLTGPESDILQTIKGFQQAYAKSGTTADGVPNILHSEKWILVDTQGHIRGFFNDDAAGTKRLLLALKNVSN